MYQANRRGAFFHRCSHSVFKWNPKESWYHYDGCCYYSHLVISGTDRRRGERLNTLIKDQEVSDRGIFTRPPKVKLVWKKDMSNKYRYFRTLEKGFTEFCQLRLLHLESVGFFKNKHKQKSFSPPSGSFSVREQVCSGRWFLLGDSGLFSAGCPSWLRLPLWGAGIPQGKAAHCA